MPDFTVQRIDHVAINVSDVSRASSFYHGLLGLAEIARPPTFLFAGAWYRAGDSCLHLVSKGNIDAPRTSHFALWVSDVHAAARTISAAGYPVDWDRTKIAGIDRFFTSDPDGNRLEIQGTEARHGTD